MSHNRTLQTTGLRVLFIGGTGILGAPSARSAIASGMSVTLMNRSPQTPRTPIEGAEMIVVDATDKNAMREAVARREFDVIVDFRAFTAADVEADIDIFDGRVGQYVFISTASVYDATPAARLPLSEATSPVGNRLWTYPQDKEAGERVLHRAAEERGFPSTIVRPAQTYDKTFIPLLFGGWTAVDRMRRGEPIVVHGDGTSIWALTHSEDFARAFVGLFGNRDALGRAVHITSDELVTWTSVVQALADTIGAEPRVVHVATETIADAYPGWGPMLRGAIAHSHIYDNSLIKSLVPGWEATIKVTDGVREAVEWQLEEPTRQTVSPAIDEMFDDLIRRWGPRGS